MWPALLSLSALVAAAAGHGRVLEPASRSSAWRSGFPTAPNYDDDGLNCGGFSMQWSVNGGKCGICGDPYNAPEPRAHELGGTHGQGVITAHYAPGALISTTIDLTAYHRGFWEFKLCPDPQDNTQECFDRHIVELENGDTKYYPNRGSSMYEVTYRLPEGLVCEHCVLQWRYTAGNNWGDCKNGTQGLGCGNQEQFGACSDISIGVLNAPVRDAPESYEQIPYPLFYYLKHGYFDAQQGLLNLLRGFVPPAPVQHHESNTRTILKLESKPRPIPETQSRPKPELNYKPRPENKSRLRLKPTRYKIQYEKKHRLRSKKKTKPRKRKKKMPYWR